MAGFVNFLLAAAIAAVTLVLFAGFFNMVRGGDGSPARSQKLMRWRVGIQALAVLLIVALLLIKGR